MNKTRKDYTTTTKREFDLRLQGIERERKEKEALLIEEWRQARFIAFNQIQPHLKKEHQNLTIFDFLPLPNDPTPEQLLEARFAEQENQKSEAQVILEMYKNLKISEESDNDIKLISD
jgi:hypothetical protein